MLNDFLLTQDDNHILNQYLVVSVDNNLYAFKLADVLEIIPFTKIESITNTTRSVVGLINLHGENVPVYDFRQHLGYKPKNYTSSQQMIVLSVEKQKLILIVDFTGEIINIQNNEILPISEKYTLDFIYATTILDNKNVMLIDAKKFFNSTDTNKNIYSFEDLMPLNPQIVAKLDNRAESVKINMGQFIEQSLFVNDKFVIFLLNNEYYCFNIKYVKYIKKISTNEITKIPLVPEFIHGLINFRGDYISLIDIKHFLNLTQTQITEKTEIVVLKIDNLKIAIFVDKVVDITSLPIDMLNLNDSYEDGFIIGELAYQNNKLLNMLNIEKLFSIDNMNLD